MKLEQIFWKNGKLVNSKDEEIKAEPIGIPLCITTYTVSITDTENIEKEFDKIKTMYLNGDYLKANAFLEGLSQQSNLNEHHTAVQFYKI